MSVKISRVRIDSSSRRSTLYDDGWAETWAVTQLTTQGVLGQFAAAPTTNVRYITRRITATNWRIIPATVRMAGAAGLMLVTGTLGEKYRPDAPESKIAVDDNRGITAIRL